MFRKICILLLIALSFKNGECKDDGPGFLSMISDLPFDMMDTPLAAASDAIYNAFDYASKFVEALSGQMGEMTGKVLHYAHEIAENTIDSMRSVVKALRSAKNGIGETLSGIHSDLSSAKDNFLQKFQSFKETILKDANKNSLEFLKNCTEAAKYQIEIALESGKVTLENALQLADEFIKNAKEKGEKAKVEVLEKLSAELKKLQEEYDGYKHEICEKLKNLIEDLKNAENEQIEDIRKYFEEHLQQMKSAINDASELVSKVKSQVEELIKAGKESVENLSSDLQAKVEHIQEHLKGFAEKAVAFREEVLSSAKQSIESIVEQSKGTIASFFDSLAHTFKAGIFHLNELYNATLSLVGDFFKEKQPHVDQTRSNVEHALGDVDEKKSSFLEGVKDITEAFAAKIASYSEESEDSDVNFAGDAFEHASSAFKDILNKIHGISENGKAVVEDIFQKGLHLFEESKAHITSAISDDIEYLKEKSQQMKKHLKVLASDIKEKIKEAKQQVQQFLSETFNKIRERVSEIYNAIVEQVKQGVAGAKEVYYKISKKVDALKEQANEALEDFKAQAAVKIADAIEDVKVKAEEVQKYVESKFIQGSKKCIECLKEHKDVVPSLLSDVTKQLNECGSEGFKSAANSIKESFDTDELSPKLEKLSQMYKECKKNSGFFGSVSCLGKLPIDETLGLSKAASGISAGVEAAAKNVAACTSETLEKAGNSFTDFRATIDHCLEA